MSGLFDYTSLPLYATDCLVYFPSQNEVSSPFTSPSSSSSSSTASFSYSSSTDPTSSSSASSSSSPLSKSPGILVELIRLNVPCHSGGYIKFTDNPPLCGKLEELPDNERTYHFDISQNFSIKIFNKPMFSLKYQIVDYCYNMTLLQRNGTFFIKPFRGTLECYFKIHLPYGNKIDLNLITNKASELNQSDKYTNEAIYYDNLLEVNKKYSTHINLSNLNNNNNSNNNHNINNNNNNSSVSDKRNKFGSISDTRYKNDEVEEDIDCKNSGGMLVRIFETKLYKWSYCIYESNETKRFSLMSRGNVLVIRVVKTSTEPYQHTRTSLMDKFSKMMASERSTMMVHQTPTLYFTYRARPIPEIVSGCAFGWIAVKQLCITAVQTAMNWHEGEQYCIQQGGHLASISSDNEQKIFDQLLINSPGYQDNFAYWIGGSDQNFESDFRWSDGLPFLYTNWFPGWPEHAFYNKQPNDDGLSGQDCIELRRYFRAPPGTQQTEENFSNTFMWNDRDCSAKNFIICEKSMKDETSQTNWTHDCNKTIDLSKSDMKISLWSPLFPRQYPDNANCFTIITAPSGYRIVLEFEELVLENEPGCSYDYIEISEPHGNLKRSNDQNHGRTTSRHGRRQMNHLSLNSYENFSLSNNFENAQTNDENLSIIFSNLFSPWSNILIQTPPYPRGKPLFKTARTQDLPRRMCGDWSSKLKLLRYTSVGSFLGLHFVSDYSHHYGGYKAKVYMENTVSECDDDKLKFYNGSCYLFIHYPWVNWYTAQHVCRSIGAELSSVGTPDEHRFITINIRNDSGYNPERIYWLGGKLSDNQQYQWSDNTTMSFQGWLPGQGIFDKRQADLICLGMQWKMSPTPMLPSGLYWESQKCSNAGGYVCKKPKQSLDLSRLKNETVSGSEGRLTSPGYPNPYPLNIDYWVRISSPERTRIIVQFQKIDLESQDECLYDYIIVQNYETISEISLEPGTNPIPMAMLTADKDLEELQYSNRRMQYARRIRSVEHIHQFEKYLTTSFESQMRLRRLLRHLYADIDIDSNSVISNSTSPSKERFSSIQINRKRRRKKKDIARKFQTNWRNRRKRHASQIIVDVDVDNAQSFLPYVRWCGSHDSNMSKFDFISSSNEVILNFHSDYSVSGLGFAATWKAIDISACPIQTLTSREGVISSPNYPHFLINNLDCTYVIQAPIGNKVWLEFKDFDIVDDSVVFIDIGYGPFKPFRDERHINEGVFISVKEQIRVQIKTGQKPRGRGFQVNFKTVWSLVNEKVVYLSNTTSGYLFHLNYPQKIPANVEFLEHFIVPLGNNILLELYGVEFSENGCPDNNVLEVYDNYADKNGTRWNLCRNLNPNISLKPQSPVQMTSFLNTIHIRQKTAAESHISLNATIRVQRDDRYKNKLVNDDTVESCVPNPCQFDGKCLVSKENVKRCQCPGHFTGKFCGLNMCELNPCLFGNCELTPLHFKCHCQTGYTGRLCEQKRKPCAENPCEGRGECFEKNGGFFCRCHAWWEGQRCERRMIHIPYKPLSERMLQEPFWLGLITVFVVLAIIGLIWCAKRHFPEKIEKLLAEEAERNRPPGVGHHHHTSLREQLQFTTSIPQTTVVTPGAPRSIFNRLGIRKPSILSLSSPNPPGGATARTFSLDDLLRPPPRRSPSPRKKRNNSTPTKKNAAEKKQILQQLVSPVAAQPRSKVTLGELIQMSENQLKIPVTTSSETDLKETNFSENNSGSTPTSATRPLTDPKLEKKVTFARLLNKVSAEMSSGSADSVRMTFGMYNSSALSLPSEIQFLPASVPPSPCTNDLRSPHSTSSNAGSESLSSSEIALSDICMKVANSRRIRPKVSSADSILAMFRCQTTASSTPLQTSSLLVSPSTTPTPSSPQDDIPGDDESSTSSMHTPVSFSSGAPDSPVFYRQTTIEVPVLDALNAHKNASSNTNLLHPPTILLEIPSNGINKCLSPIRELPTPMPSPALTPIMPRPNRSNSPLLQDDPLSASYSDDEDRSDLQISDSFESEVNTGINRIDSEIETLPTDTATTSMADSKNNLKTNLMPPSITIDVEPPTPEERTPRPKDLIIPTLTVEQPSPTKRLPTIIFPGSPPPQRASIGETSFMFPNKQQQKRLLKQYEKPTSLDLSFTPPMITVTSNMNELESDIEPLSPAPNKVSGPTTLLAPVNQVGMCYLSPFAICTRADRTISESNLSSSGYSSMASPGPSRCGSNNPLFSNEMDEPGSGSSGPSFPLHVNLLSRRQTLPICKENILNEQAANEPSDNGNHVRGRRRSDSETLSDDPLLESNDEGIGTDHLDDKPDDSERRGMKPIIEVSVTEEMPEASKSVPNVEDVVVMSQLQLPSIVIQPSENNDKGLSPVSSRSESPLSERAGMGRFSPQFYGRKDHQLPFTDSDGLYDFPSSDSKGTIAINQRRSSCKKRERKSPKMTGTSQSPTRNLHLDLPSKETSASGSHLPKHLHYQHHHPHHSTTVTARKSPKRRPVQRYPVASSSSSTESLTSTREYTIKHSPIKDMYLRNCNAEENSGEDVSSQILPTAHCSGLNKPRICRLRAISNQIRFLRRLEKSIKRRDKEISPSDSSCLDDDGDSSSPRMTSPLLQHPSSYSTTAAGTSNIKNRTSGLCRQNRLPSSSQQIADQGWRPSGRTIARD